MTLKKIVSNFKFSLVTIGQLGLGIHVFLILLFYFLEVPEMITYNIFSSLFFASTIYLIKQGFNNNFIFFLFNIEILLHAFLASYFIGLESNFILFAFLLLSAYLVKTKWTTWQSTLYFILIATFHITISFYLKSKKPIYTINENTLFFIKTLILAFIAFAVFLCFLYYNTVTNKIKLNLIAANQKLTKKNDEKSSIIKEIHHRIKNNLQVVISLLRLQSSKTNDEKVANMFKSTQKRIFSMALLHENLLQEYNLELINIKEHFKQLGENLIKSYALDKEIKQETNIQDINLGMQTLTPLGLMVNEIITNSIKYAFNETQDGKISINLRHLSDKNTKYVLKTIDVATHQKSLLLE